MRLGLPAAHQRIAIVIAGAIIMSGPTADPTQIGSQMGNAINNAFCGAVCSALGTQKIAEGQQNHDQGQQMQNMAQMAMGAMQIAQGLLGLMAAAQANQNAAQSGANADGLSGLGNGPIGGGATSPTPNGTNPDAGTTGSSNVGDLSTQGSSVSLKPSDLRSGTVGMAMDTLEKNYGINRDQFVAGLAAGTSPQDLLSHAPKNAPSAELLDKIATSLAANNTAGKEAADRFLASVGGAGVNNGSLGAGDGSVNLANASSAKKPAASNEGNIDDLLPPTGDVSPEVKAAMAAKAAQLKAEKEMREMNGWNIFQLVHSRYQKLETMLYGRVDRTNASPTSGQKGF